MIPQDFATARNPPSVPSNDTVAHTPPMRQNPLDLGSVKEFPVLDESTETPNPPVRLPMQRALSFKSIIDKAKTSPASSPKSVKLSVSSTSSPKKDASPRSKESSKISYASAVASAATVKAL